MTENIAKLLTITSSSNNRYKQWKSLLESRGIKRNGLALVSGAKIVPEVMQSHPEIVEGIIYHTTVSHVNVSFHTDVPRYNIKNVLFRELDVHGTDYPLLLVRTPVIDNFEECSKYEPVIMLIPFQDPVNVGAAIRSSAAFGIRTIVLLSEAALPFHPKSIRAGGTAIFNVSYYYGPSIYDLSRITVPIIALKSVGTDLKKFVFPEKFALLPGLEGQGMPENIKADYILSIPIEPDVESLNATVAASIALYEYTSKQRI